MPTNIVSWTVCRVPSQVIYGKGKGIEGREGETRDSYT